MPINDTRKDPAYQKAVQQDAASAKQLSVKAFKTNTAADHQAAADALAKLIHSVPIANRDWFQVQSQKHARLAAHYKKAAGASQGTPTMPTPPVASASTSRKAAYLSRVAANQGAAVIATAADDKWNLLSIVQKHPGGIDVYKLAKLVGKTDINDIGNKMLAHVKSGAVTKFSRGPGAAWGYKPAGEAGATASATTASAAFGKPPAQPAAAPAPAAPIAPPAPEPDPASVPLPMSRKAKYLRRMLQEQGGAVPAASAQPAPVAAPASIAAASDPASQGRMAAKRENNPAITQRIKQVLGNDPAAVKQAIGVYVQAGPHEFLKWIKENYGDSVVAEMRRAGVGASQQSPASAAHMPVNNGGAIPGNVWNKKSAASSGNREVPINRLQQLAREGKLEYSTDPKVGMHIEVRWPNGKKEWVMVRAMRQAFEPGGLSNTPASGTPVAAAIASRNTSHGFYGTARLNGLPDAQLAKAFDSAARNLQRLGLTPDQSRDFLDSRDGRHLADAIVVEGKLNPQLPAWIAKQVKSFLKTYDPSLYASISAAASPSYTIDNEGMDAIREVSSITTEVSRLLGRIQNAKITTPQAGALARAMISQIERLVTQGNAALKQVQQTYRGK